jgi:two-component system LytT family response regulator
LAECHTGEQAVSAIRKDQADLVLLAIRMHGKDGFQVPSHLSLEEMPVIIFTNAFDRNALRAFAERSAGSRNG